MLLLVLLSRWPEPGTREGWSLRVPSLWSLGLAGHDSALSTVRVEA